MKSVKDFIVWDPIKVGRGSYIVEYNPARTDQTIAILALVFTSSMDDEEIAQLLEKEFAEWARKYPTYLFASAWDEKEDQIELDHVRPAKQITGYYDAQTHELLMLWGLLPENEATERLKRREHLVNIYAGLPYKTAEQCAANAEKHLQQMRKLKRALGVWEFTRLFIWPLLKKIPLISGYLMVRNYGKAISKWQRFTGERKLTPGELVQEEKELRARHILYHVEKNPEAFELLKAQNFERDAKERVSKEAENLKLSNR